MGVMPVDGIMRENESGIFSTDDQSMIISRNESMATAGRQ